MKRTTLIPCAAFILMALASACNSNTGNKDNKTDSAKTTPTTTAQQTAVSPLAELNNFTGKYPKEVQLLENAKLKPRLQQLLGKDFDALVKYWNTETPITAEGRVLSTTGCEQHNCGNNQYLLYIDISNDNINVFHINKGKMKKYAEKGEIKLPTAMQKDFETIKSNMK